MKGREVRDRFGDSLSPEREETTPEGPARAVATRFGLLRKLSFINRGGKTTGAGLVSRNPRFWLIPLFASVVFYGSICLGLFVHFGKPGVRRFGTIVAGVWFYIIPGTGKILAVPLMVGNSVHPVLAAVSTVFMDAIVAFTVAFNFAQVERVPILEKLVKRMMDRSGNLLQRRGWLQNFSFVGLVCFVAIPIEGSGGVGGTVLGLMMGLGPTRAVAAVILGSSVRSFSLAYGADAASRLIAEYHLVGVLALMLCLAVIAFSSYRGHWGRRKSRDAGRGVRRAGEEPSKAT